MSEIVKIKTVDATPRRIGRFLTYSELWINPLEYSCGVEQRNSRDTRTSEVIFRVILTYDICEDFRLRVSSDELKKYLLSSSAQELLIRVCKGWSNEFKGTFWYGNLDMDGSSAVDKLLSDITDLPHTDPYSEPSLLSAEEWIDRSIADVSAVTTDSELEELADIFENNASKMGAIIVNGIYNLVKKWRDEAVGEWQNRAKDSLKNGWNEAVINTSHSYQEGELVFEFYFRDGSYGMVVVSDDETKVLVAPENEVEQKTLTG